MVILRPNHDIKDHKDLQNTLTTWASSNIGVKSDTSSCINNDYTRYANREVWSDCNPDKVDFANDVKIGLPVDEKEEEEKDRLLSSEEVDSLFLEFKGSTPAIDVKKRRKELE